MPVSQRARQAGCAVEYCLSSVSRACCQKSCTAAVVGQIACVVLQFDLTACATPNRAKGKYASPRREAVAPARLSGTAVVIRSAFINYPARFVFRPAKRRLASSFRHPRKCSSLNFRQCTVHTMHGSNERTTCWIVGGAPSPAGRPTRACSSGPGRPSLSRGEKFQVVGAMI